MKQRQYHNSQYTSGKHILHNTIKDIRLQFQFLEEKSIPYAKTTLSQKIGLFQN